MKAIDYLARFENDCLDLYETLGSKTTNPELKELFLLLTDSRQRHLVDLIARNAAIGGDDASSVQIERAEQVVNGCRQTLLSTDIVKAMRNDSDAYSHLVHAEEDMIRLCTGMARVETDEKVKAILDWFVDDETKHLQEIKGIYDFVEAPHSFLEWGEFSNLHPL